MRRLAIALFAALTALPATAEEFRSTYSVSYLGLTVARSEFTTTVDDETFSVRGTLRSSGLAQLFDDTEGRIAVSGRLAESGPVPETYGLDYRTDDKKKHTAISFKDGTVVDAVNEPPIKKSRKNWVEVEAEHLRAVSDPISATMVRANSLAEVCRRTIRVFDGGMRVDLELSPIGEGEWNGAPTASCEARFVPVAGYRKGKKQIEYLAKKSRITIDFAPLGATGLYAPAIATVGTKLGTVTIEAEAPAVAGN